MFKPKNKQNKRVERKNKNFKSKAKQMAKDNNYQDAFADEERSKVKYPVKDAHADRNDPQWYFKSASLLKDVASFSFARPLGSPVLGVTQPSNSRLNNKVSNWNSIPGVMAIKLVPTVGISRDAQSPLNVGAQNIYTRVRYKNSGAANYDAPDLMMYYLAMSSLYSAWNWMKRIYGYASYYSQTSWYNAYAFAKAENIDLEDILANLADFRAYLNMSADKINAFCVPAVFNYIVRHSWLYSNIYKDSDTTKAQCYMFTPALFHRYDEYSSSNGGKLVPIDVNTEARQDAITFKQLQTILNTMINSLQYSSDIGNMSGDTLKEFGSNLFTLSYVDPDYNVVPVYNKEVLTQFENAYFFGTYYEGSDDTNPGKIEQFAITQDPNTNWLKFEPVFTRWTSIALNDWFVNFHWENPTPEDVMVATRLNVGWTIKDATSVQDSTYVITECGSEIAIAVSVVSLIQDADIGKIFDPTKKFEYKVTNLNSVFGGNPVDQTLANYQAYTYTALRTVLLWTAFDWAPPLMAYAYTNATTGTVKEIRQFPPLRDWDMYVQLDSQDYSALNTLALQSLFNVPN